MSCWTTRWETVHQRLNKGTSESQADYLGTPTIMTQLILKLSRGSGLDGGFQRLQVWPTTTMDPSGTSPRWRGSPAAARSLNTFLSRANVRSTALKIGTKNESVKFQTRQKSVALPDSNGPIFQLMPFPSRDDEYEAVATLLVGLAPVEPLAWPDVLP